jgi:hypothetical protein
MSKIALLILLALASCGPDTPALDNPNTKYEFLGTVDGCRLWHVAPSSYPNFTFANCGSKASTQTTQNCGKGCTRYLTVSTEGGKDDPN